MAAGTDITHPVSALEGVYKSLPLESLPLCTIKENGTALDNSEFSASEQHQNMMTNDREAASRPPIPIIERPLSGVRRSVSTTHIASLPSSSHLVENKTSDPPATQTAGASNGDYFPMIRSGGWMDIGIRSSMEDTHLRIDDLVEHAGSLLISEGPGAFYGVFDGHGGKEAASFVREHLLTKILENVALPTSMGEALRNAFLETDLALVDDVGGSGTTALTAMVCGRTLLVANAGDCRAVLSRRGSAVDMSRDHKPGCSLEKSRIEAAGGFVCDGYLNGQLAVARALGDWRITGLKELGDAGPLSAEPEVQQATLTEEDEFLIIGCDGLWDVFTSQNAVDYARRKLQEHNDPERCSKELVAEALRRNTCDNLTVVTVCFTPNPPPKPQVYIAPKPQGYVPRFRRSISAEGLKSLQGYINTYSLN
ncbi:unnamed protein product [Calypogeia fissa]